MSRSVNQLAGALCLLSLGVSSAEASIIGQTIRIDWLYPDSSTVYDTSGNVVVADPGVEWFAGSGAGDIDVGNGTITIENLTAGWGAGSFNGFRFTDALGAIGAFTSFSLVSITGFAPPIAPALSFTADELLVNFTPTGDDNIGDGVGQVYTFAFTIGAVPVPEPASLALLGLGLVGVAAARRRRVA